MNQPKFLLFKPSFLITSTFVCLVSIIISGCANSVQKTSGQGLVSVIAQNVVRIAGVKAVRDLNLKDIKDQKTNLQIQGFVNESNKGFITSLISSKIESVGGKLVDASLADFVVEVTVNAAGNDNGSSEYIVGGSERTEGSIDLTVVTRSAKTGDRIATQTIRGYAKYQQGSFLKFQGDGSYFYKQGENWVAVEDPAKFK